MPVALSPFAPADPDALLAEMVGRQCHLEPYTPIRPIKPVPVTGEIVAFASPDSTYAVTKRLFDAAAKSILIGIYDFAADYVKEALVRAMARGVKVALMLDIDSDKERVLFDDLKRYGAECVEAPSCASDHVSYFASSHEKVVVIDDEITIIQSGNYSYNSIPFNEKDGADPAHFTFGNRDCGVVVRSKPLAKFFTKVLRADMALELAAEGLEVDLEPADLPFGEFVTEAPRRPPPKLFKSKTFLPTAPVPVLPVLSPDNYMAVVPGFLRAAKASIVIEQQYIRQSQPLIGELIAAIRAAKAASPKLKVRIIVARPLARGAAFEKEMKAIRGLADHGFEMGGDVRLLNPDHFVHCHNKLIVVDGKRVLVGSQNWSDFAVGKNREASLLIDHPGVANYFAAIFAADWATGVDPSEGVDEVLAFGTEALGGGGSPKVRVTAGDYAEV